MRILLGFLFVFSSVLFLGSSASAKEVTVNNPDELIKAVDDLSEHTIIQLSKDFSLENDITLSVRRSYPLEINSNKKKFEGMIRFDTYTYMENLSLKNFAFDGKGKKAVGFQFDMKPSSGIWITIEDSSFENSTEAVISKINVAKAYYRNALILQNVLVQNNKSKKHGVVEFHDSTEIEMKNSSFIDNENSSSILGGGALTMENNTSTWIRNSIFEGNKLTGIAANGVTLGGGAIYSTNDEDNRNGTIWSVKSIYKNNKTNLEENQHGGAIFKRHKTGSTSDSADSIQNEGVVFVGNKSSGYGGAIAYQTDPEVENNNPTYFYLYSKNSIFISNESIVKENETNNGGSAIAFFNLNQNNKHSFVRNFSLLNTTFYKNKAYGGKGNNSAVFVDQYKTKIDMKESVLGFNIGDNSFENISSNGNVINHENSFGVDNGVTIPGESEKIFGKYPIQLRSNYSEIKAGYVGNRQVIPSIQLIPKFTDNNGLVTKGIANEIKSSSIYVYNNDIRGIYRGILASAGAIETTSILYDANGGNFNKKELTEFEGKEYYEGNNPTQVAKLYLPNSSKKIVSASKDLKINRKGAKFIGWSTNRKALKPESKYAQGKIVKLDQQLKLYAVWNVEKHNVRFYSNGKTDGVLSKSYRVNTDDEVEIPKTVKVKRKGYKFIGWSYLPNATKADKSLSLGTKLKITKSLKIYAVWKKTK